MRITKQILDAVMREAKLNPDLDLHTYTAALVLDKMMDRVTYAERHQAKNAMFLYLYEGPSDEESPEPEQKENYCQKCEEAQQSIKALKEELKDSIKRIDWLQDGTEQGKIFRQLSDANMAYARQADDDKERIESLLKKLDPLYRVYHTTLRLRDLVHSTWCVPNGCSKEIIEEERGHCSACENTSRIIREVK